MRARLVFIVAAILLVGAFAALNWSEFMRMSPLSFGGAVSEAPLGFIMLCILGVTLLAFLISSAAQESRNLADYGRHARALEAQRELADRAEASRFTDLRTHMETLLRENRQREAIAATEFEKAIVQSQRDIRTQLEQMNQAMATQLRDFETRFDSRIERLNVPAFDATGRPVEVPIRDRVKL